MNRHTSDAVFVESSYLTGVRRRVSSGSSSSFENDATSTKTSSFEGSAPTYHHGWNRSRVGRHSQVCLVLQHLCMRDATFRQGQQIIFLSMIIPFDNLIRFCQNSPFNVLLLFFRALRRDNRGSGIYKTAAIYVLRKEKRLLTTGQITRYIL